MKIILKTIILEGLHTILQVTLLYCPIHNGSLKSFVKSELVFENRFFSCGFFAKVWLFDYLIKNSWISIYKVFFIRFKIKGIRTSEFVAKTGLLSVKEMSFCQKLKFVHPYIFAIQCCRPLIFRTINSVRSV